VNSKAVILRSDELCYSVFIVPFKQGLRFFVPYPLILPAVSPLMKCLLKTRYSASTGTEDSVSTARTLDQSVWYCPNRRVTPSRSVFDFSSEMNIRGNQRSFQNGTMLYIATVAMAGRSKGIIIFVKILNGPAPSISAASRV